MPSPPSELRVDVVVDTEAPVPPDISEASLRSLAEHVLTTEGEVGHWELGIRFVDDRTMQRAHADFMGIDEPTDIMTFPYQDESFSLPGGDSSSAQGGDLLISTDRAADHAADAGWSVSQELLFLVCHGLLHLIGWDDATDAKRAQMLGRQAVLLQSWPGVSGA